MQTDPVTNLKNRVYMEDVLSKIDQSQDFNGWIIMGDINGLKLVNDSFGHTEGDKLLKKIGEILIKCCSKYDIPARWGGDEFLILVKNQDESYIEDLIKKIQDECLHNNSFLVKVSMAMGSAKKNQEQNSIKETLKTAEERMYRNKLLESRSARSAIISSLEQSLHEKNIEAQEHTERIKDMCILIGRKLGLNQNELDEIALLGLLHDIGKIGIPEAVLLKPGKLTDEEWEIMKTHSEIGYRIAASTPELAYIANEILSHHERYDGKGYPQGLIGDEIPKLSRLLSIVDSFDAMTQDRVYRKAKSFEEAINEIKACSGKQYDPEFVEVFVSLFDESSKNGRQDT